MGEEREDHVSSIETSSDSPQNDQVSSVVSEELEATEPAEVGLEIKDMALQSDEVLEEEISSDVDVEWEGKYSDRDPLIEEVSTLGGDDSVQILISGISEEHQMMHRYQGKGLKLIVGHQRSLLQTYNHG